VPAVASVAGLPSRLGKYELLLPLAAGGMARIYIGRSTGIGSFERHVVLKLITPERANDHTAVQMFLDEARLAASLNHQNVAQVFEVGEDSNIHYLAMEYVHGQDLRALLAKAGSQGTRIPLELALTVVAGAAAGLNHAHERRNADGTPMGIVHRDVSPSNIMIGYDGAVKLLDFGIAKASQRSVETQSGIIKGKFAYMAPEQCRGREVDRRSDVFSLGIILYEISTQHRCFRADSDFDTMHRIVTGDVVRPTRLVQAYPPALEAIVMKALAVDAAQRYQSAGLLLEAIEAFAVSARLSLSTMGLGRFMRDMFGEVQEPWLGAPQKSPVVVKENTISSTDGRSDVVPNPRPPTATNSESPSHDDADAIPDADARFPDSGGVGAGKTILDLPRGPNDQQEPAEPGWNAKSYPSTPPSMASNETLPPEAQVQRPPQPRASQPHPSQPHVSVEGKPTTPPRGISQQQPAQPGVLATPPQGMPPQSAGTPPKGHFAQTPGSGSGPAIPAPQIVSTRHGYASGGAVSMPGVASNDLSYPRYQSQPGDDFDMQLRPSRRALFIGIAVLAVGIILVVSLVLGGGSKQDDAMGTKGSDEVGSASANTPTPPNVETPPADAYISVHIVSDPKGADVIIAGTKVGVTPFDGKLPHGTTLTPLVVHMAGYTDYQTKIDLGGEYSNDKIKLVKLPDKTGQEPDKTGPDKTGPDKTGQEPDKTGPDKTGQEPDKTGPDKTGQEPDKTGPDKTGPDKTGTEPDKTKHNPIQHNPIQHNPTTTTHTPTHTTTTTHTPTTTTHSGTGTDHTVTPPTHETPKIKCQPAGSMNPFDTSCDGKACPPCK
jgi:serine/threonine protein kinase